MAWKERTPLETALEKNGLAFIGGPTHIDIPTDLRIEGDRLKWTVESSNPDPKTRGKLKFAVEINDVQKSALLAAGLPEIS